MRRRKKKGPVQAKKISYDGISFASGLERYTYIALKKNKLYEGYESETFQIIESFNFPNVSYEKQANSKGEYINRGSKKILGIKYTPDFIGKDYIIECKGRPNESFPLRWKLFKLWLTKNNIGKILYKPQNQKEVDRTIALIKEYRRNKRGYCIQEDYYKRI